MAALKTLKKHFMVAFLAAGMVLGATAGAQAVDFKAKGEWLVGFGLGNANLQGGAGTPKDDLFSASQRIRLQLDAVASENLSGTVFFEIGTQDWGYGDEGGALGADGIMVKVKNAYIDWTVPETDLAVRMGLQAFALPNAAGGSAIMDGDVAAVTGTYKFSDEVSLTAFWMRPANDNYQGYVDGRGRDKTHYRHYLDNIDFFGLTVPLTFDGFEITPWAMYGMIGRNALDSANGWDRNGNVTATDGDMTNTLFATLPGQNLSYGFRSKGRAYADAWFFGLPISVTALDPVNIEFDVNYGYVSGVGRHDVFDYKNNRAKRADSRREGWLIKALVEYKMDWGVPGIFGWYSSGDDGDVKNGSERIPSVAGAGNFTSFMGCAGTDWWADNVKGGLFYEMNMTYAGTWGVGLHVRDMTFLEDLSHTFRVAYWGGTNSPDMVKYVNQSGAGMSNITFDGPYLTKNDGLVEFNLDNTYKIYENLSVNLDLGYIINCYDRGTWSRRWTKGNGNGMSKHDAWKAQLTFAYTF
ncbi:MAG: outer membrane homotrimeric porin [Desulfovibrionaceae bacterium]|nr:outer membrane homotrimeric porin [Desulfovibrionaceae bacterium]